MGHPRGDEASEHPLLQSQICIPLYKELPGLPLPFNPSCLSSKAAVVAVAALAGNVLETVPPLTLPVQMSSSPNPLDKPRTYHDSGVYNKCHKGRADP
jgi:hypothetical protein